MKTKTTFVTILALLLASCSLLGSPTATVKKFMAATQKGDADAMTQLFSKKVQQKIGLEKIRANNKQFSDTLKRASAVGGNYRMDDIAETPTTDGKRVAFFYKNDNNTDSLRLVFDLSKESGAWKIDNIGGRDSEEVGSSPSPSASVVVDEPPPLPPSPVNENEKNQSQSASKRAPISGGVLNGKAITLPAPPYPPIARAAKASGTVVVQVTLDEQGNVISARAVSGHPLLQAAAVAAARNAKFSPTRLSGEPVRVTGVITYNFPPQ
jgi:TonB family protein